MTYAVQRIASEWEAAWNTHDMARMAKLLTADADFVNVLGRHWKGVAQIERAHASMHATQFRESTWTNERVQAQLLHPGFALVHFAWSIRGDSDPDDTPNPTFIRATSSSPVPPARGDFPLLCVLLAASQV